jgi:uncharacterized protein YegP (UPF0339 family)
MTEHTCGRVFIYKAKRGLLRRQQYRARIVAGNGRNLFVSSEGYNNLADLEGVIARCFPGLPVYKDWER